MRDVAGIQHDDPVAAGGDELGVMRDDQAGDAALREVRQKRGGLVHVLEIQAAGGFIEHEEPALGRERPRNGDALLLAAGKRQRMLLGQRLQIEPRQHLVHVGLVIAPAPAMPCEAHAQANLLFYRRGEQLVVDVLHDQVALPKALLARHLAPVDADGAPHSLLEPADAAHQGALARTVVPYDAHDRARRDCEPVDRDAGYAGRLAVRKR